MTQQAFHSEKRAPRLPGYPFVGALPHMRKDPLNFLIRAMREHGDVVQLGNMGRRPVFLISHPDYVKEILLNSSGNIVNGPNMHVLDHLGPDNIFLLPPEQWKSRRQLLQPIFKAKQVNIFALTMIECVEIMQARWDEMIPRGPIDLGAEMTRITLDVILRTMFSTDIGTVNYSGIAEAIEVVMEFIGARLWSPVPIPLFIPTSLNRRFSAALQVINHDIYRLIRERRAHPKETQDFLTLLLAAKDDEGRQMTDQQIHDEVIAFFIAGHETTACALTWVWYQMAQQPALVSQIQAEIDAKLGDRTVSTNDLPALPISKQVLDETMRLYPPGWASSRSPTQDLTFGGFTIPAHSILFISPYVTQRRADLFTHPDSFHLEHFDEPQASARPRFSFFPFGGGAHGCMAQAFATTEALLIMTSVFQRYSFSLVPDKIFGRWRSIPCVRIGPS